MKQETREKIQAKFEGLNFSEVISDLKAQRKLYKGGQLASLNRTINALSEEPRCKFCSIELQGNELNGEADLCWTCSDEIEANNQ